MNYYCPNNDEVRSAIVTWWKSLEYDTGLRATLKRSETISDVFFTEGFITLFKKLRSYLRAADEEKGNLDALAAIAGVLSIVKTNDTTKSFAEQCAQGIDHPVVSEMRFSALQKSRTIDELFTRMRRIVHQLGESVNILYLADDILHWYKEIILNDENSNVRNTIRMRWGMDYFLNATEKSK